MSDVPILDQKYVSWAYDTSGTDGTMNTSEIGRLSYAILSGFALVAQAIEDLKEAIEARP